MAHEPWCQIFHDNFMSHENHYQLFRENSCPEKCFPKFLKTFSWDFHNIAVHSVYIRIKKEQKYS